MKKQLQYFRVFLLGKKHLFLSFMLIFFIGSLYAQFYSYTTEGFEGMEWATAPNNTNIIQASTGDWSVARNNIRIDTYAQDGIYSLIIATKTNALITPFLTDGAGTLSFHINKPTGGGRKITIETSMDKSVWTKIIDEESVTSEWAEKNIEINDKNVKYISFSTNSNGGVYLDNILITKAPSTTVVDHVEIDKVLVKTHYYNLSGVRVYFLSKNTFYIQENIYEDGSIERIKIFNKN